MDQPRELPRVGQLVRQVARPELRADGYPVAVDHIFAMYTGDDTAPPHPIRVTIATAAGEGSGQPVLATLEIRARQMLADALDIAMVCGIER